MEETKIKYPIGQQDFKSLRNHGCVYIDKTPFFKKIIDDGRQYISLARPRRFGKSLFLSTLKYFFEGERELFKGLFIDSIDWNWESYPVLRLDLNTDSYSEPVHLDSLLDNIFKKWEKEYEVKEIGGSLATRFQNIIEVAHLKTGR
ncbi:MAG: AAA family ATPase [Muribaculaceae bacterium]|nr:AAA family ATPase [Muribaculaceae bacterium]